MAERTTTLLVDPDPAGHHFQFVAFVAREAEQRGDVVLLTSRGAAKTDEYGAHLEELVRTGRLDVVEALDGIRPPTADIAAAVAEVAVRRPSVSHVLLMDGDQALKRWWLVAPRALRAVPRRLHVSFMLTRYPARLRLTDLVGWRLRGPKAVLAVLAMGRGCLRRVVGFSGRDDFGGGVVVKRIGDTNEVTAHSRDRARWREQLDLPQDELLVGVFGVISERRNAPMILEAMLRSGVDATLVLAGALDPDVQGWVDALSPRERDRVLVRPGFLDNDTLDAYVAAVDVVPLLLTNNGPSGIMGKAESAGVPVVTAGSLVRAREAAALGAGEACDLDVDSVASALRTVLAPGYRTTTRPDQLISPARHARAMLGLRD